MGLERTLEMTILIRAINQTTGAFSGVKLAAVAALGAVAAGLAYSVKQAADFQQGLTTLVTGAGESQAALAQISDGIKQISIDTATSTDQLLKGMFMIDSAGYTAAKGGLNVLKVAAQGAKQENADLGQTANALTGLLHDYGLGSDHAAAAMNALIATEEHGKMHMQDLTTSLAQVIPISAKLGISFPQIGAAIDIMTNSSMTARQASQNLNFLVRALATAGSTNASLDALQSVGLTADQVTNTLRGPNGLYTALQLVTNAISKQFPEGSNAWNVAVKEIMGGAVGWRTAVMLTGQSTKEFNNDLANVSAAMNNTTAGVENWALTQSTFNFQIGKAQSLLNVWAIDLGTQLLPVLGNALSLFTNNANNIQAFAAQAQHAASIFWSALTPSLQDVWNTAKQLAPIFGSLFAGITPQTIQALGSSFVGFTASLEPLVKEMGDLTTSFAAFARIGLGPNPFKDVIDSTTGWFNDMTQESKQIGPVLSVLKAVGDVRPFDPASWAQFMVTVTKAQQALDALDNKQQQVLHPNVTYAELKYRQWLNYLLTGGTQTFAQWTAADNRRTEKFIANVQDSRNHVDQLKQKLLDLNGPYEPKVSTSSIDKAKQNADDLKKYLERLNGSSTWTAYINTVGNAPAGAPLVGKPHASGIINNPEGHWGLIGERGPELMYVPKGASIYPNGSFGNTGGGSASSGHTINVFVSTMAGSRAEVMRMVDLLESEIAHRFRSQTPSFALPGLT